MQQEPDITQCATRVVFPNKLYVVTPESCKYANKTWAYTWGRCRSGCTSEKAMGPAYHLTYRAVAAGWCCRAALEVVIDLLCHTLPSPL